MASQLDGALAKAIYSGFKGKLKTGTLRRQSGSSGVDEFGDLIIGSSTDYSFEGIRENYSAAYLAQSGIPQGDVKIMILLQSITVEPEQDDFIFIEGDWHQVRRVEMIDPARAAITLQSTVVKEPLS